MDLNTKGAWHRNLVSLCSLINFVGLFFRTRTWNLGPGTWTQKLAECWQAAEERSFEAQHQKRALQQSCLPGLRAQVCLDGPVYQASSDSRPGRMWASNLAVLSGISFQHSPAPQCCQASAGTSSEDAAARKVIHWMRKAVKQ